VELKRRGHRIVTVDDYNQFGCGQMIWKLDSGYFTASDPRRAGSRFLDRVKTGSAQCHPCSDNPGFDLGSLM